MLFIFLDSSTRQLHGGIPNLPFATPADLFLSESTLALMKMYWSFDVEKTMRNISILHIDVHYESRFVCISVTLHDYQRKTMQYPPIFGLRILRSHIFMWRRRQGQAYGCFQSRTAHMLIFIIQVLCHKPRKKAAEPWNKILMMNFPKPNSLVSHPSIYRWILLKW